MHGTAKDVTHEVAKYVELLEGEVFRTIENFPHYYISNMARVFTTYRNRLLKVQNSGWGYIHVTLIGEDGKAHHKRLHRLVALAFLENPKNLPDVHHKDRNRKNNLLTNLEWISTKRNTELGTGKPVYLIDVETGKQRKYVTIRKACKRLSTDYYTLMSCLNGEIENINGYQIKYA